MDDEVIATIRASTPRRWLGVGMMGGLGVLLIWVAMATPPANIFWQAFLLALGAGALVFAQLMWRATATALVLRRDRLEDTGGTLVVRIADVEKVDRGMFALKPSNGFMLVLSAPQTRAWRPGLWWRMGRRVAVGGVTSGAQTRPVADIISALVLERQKTEAD